MKAQHRKDLQTNVLADRLGRLLRNAKEGPSRQVLVIWGVVLLAAAIGLGWWYFSRHSEQENSAENRDLQEATTRDDYKKIADAHPNTPAGRMARLQLARMSLREGLEHIYSGLSDDRANARSRLEEARDSYRQLATDFKDSPIIVQQCLMGEAKAQESLGQLDDALAVYQRLANEYPDSALGKEAKERVAFLQNADHRAELEKFNAEMKRLAEAAPPAPPTSEGSKQ
jgi:predicted negative regulator of RcsB-dependent stress response